MHYEAVIKTEGVTTAKFATMSKGKFLAAMYCETTEGHFYASPKAVNVTAKDNGGKPVGMTLTYKTAISDITNNDLVLSMCGKIAEKMAVPYSRVTDAYGGYFGNKSPSLPASEPKAAATTNTTATNKTRMLNATNATNKTAAAPKQTEWKINMFVQPDPFAKTVNNADTVKAAKGKDILDAVDTVTKAKYGSPTIVATEVVEAEVKWVK